MMERKLYNDCMRPYLTGAKTKDQRKLDFCIGAKVCSGKAEDQAAAQALCSTAKKPQVVVSAPAEVSAPATPICPGKPMATWIQEEDTKNCRPCLLGPVVQWYHETLKENQHEDLANILVEKAESAEPLTLCQELDRIKSVVGDQTRERLKDFDCAAQAFNPDDSPNN